MTSIVEFRTSLQCRVENGSSTLTGIKGSDGNSRFKFNRDPAGAILALMGATDVRYRIAEMGKIGFIPQDVASAADHLVIPVAL
jgi:hypothetical protein